MYLLEMGYIYIIYTCGPVSKKSAAEHVTI